MGAEVLLTLLCSSAAGRAPGAQLLLQTRLPARGGPEHLLGRVAAFLQGRPSPGATGLCHLGSAPASCSLMAAHTAAFTDVLVNVSGVSPVPPEPGSAEGGATGPLRVALPVLSQR